MKTTGIACLLVFWATLSNGEESRSEIIFDCIMDKSYSSAGVDSLSQHAWRVLKTNGAYKIQRRAAGGNWAQLDMSPYSLFEKEDFFILNYYGTVHPDHYSSFVIHLPSGTASMSIHPRSVGATPFFSPRGTGLYEASITSGECFPS